LGETIQKNTVRKYILFSSSYFWEHIPGKKSFNIQEFLSFLVEKKTGDKIKISEERKD
jgi:hypothetical protein